MDSRNVEQNGLDLVRRAIDEINALRPVAEAVPQEGDTVLMGEEGALDSLAFVNLAVALDELVDNELGVSLGLVADLLGHEDPSEFRTVALLGRFLEKRIQSQDV